ncbi:hypothetical protein N0V90_004481 [Kalmusia sp. IMI 367209]|nr:hypothetical protein N0V90_004481 [Kalmusia sp. IMI 367209]
MTAPLRKIALVGASGHLGPHLLQALQSDPSFNVTVITRQSSKAKFPPTTQIVRVPDDYPRNELVAAFRNHDAVILSLNFQADKHHSALVEASIEAGVKQLIPSIFGGRHTPEVQSIFPFAAGKAAMLAHVEKRAQEVEGWGYTAVCNGLFHELCVQTSFYGIDAKARTATVWDDGKTKFSASTYAGVSSAVLRVLREPEGNRNRTVYVSSFEVSLGELLDTYKSTVGAEGWSVEYKDAEEGIKEAKETSQTTHDFMTRMRAIGRLALLSSVKRGAGADFVAEGLSDSERLGVEREDAKMVTRKVLEEVY